MFPSHDRVCGCARARVCACVCRVWFVCVCVMCDVEKQALQEISFDKINELTKIGDHYKFLQDLLTSKDSFVRKKIIDQNLSYLNSRLTNYLDKIGLPHTVVFKNDLSVEITELGRELDFDNLSRGERNRLILGLSLAVS